MSKRDCELRPNRSSLVGYVNRTGTSKSERVSCAKQNLDGTENQKAYMAYLMKKLDDNGVKYRKPNNPDSNVVLNRIRWYAKVIGALQKLCRANKVDISDWERRREKKEPYKPYNSAPVPRKLSARKEQE